MGYPFLIRGQDFLTFYIIFAIVVVGAAYFARLRIEAQDFSLRLVQELSADPYAIALLQGGMPPLLSVTVLALIDRKLLTIERDTLLNPTGADAVAIARRPIEKAVLQCCMQPATMASLQHDGNIRLTVEHMTVQLQSVQLLPDSNILLARGGIIGGGLLLLWGVAATKIYIALQTNHYNVWFLIILALVAGLVIIKITRRPRTARGDRVLTALQDQFAALKDRATTIRLGGETNDLELLTSIFGFAVLSSDITMLLQPMNIGFYPGDGGLSFGGSSCGVGALLGSGSSCSGGSSCSSASSCSGGSSSCGGGGGGCGGCGG